MTGLRPAYTCNLGSDCLFMFSEASKAMNICYIASTYSTCSLEEIAAAAPAGFRWFQLYLHRNRTIAEQLVRKAEALGFQALVLTADLPYTGKRRDDIRNNFQLLSSVTLKNLEGFFEVCKRLAAFHVNACCGRRLEECGAQDMG